MVLIHLRVFEKSTCPDYRAIQNMPTFPYRSVSTWNSLAESVVIAHTVASFKTALEIVIHDDLYRYANQGINRNLTRCLDFLHVGLIEDTLNPVCMAT